MKRKLVTSSLVALAVPAAALAKPVGNATLTVVKPHKVGSEWVGSAALKASSKEALQLQVCVESNGKTVKQSCLYVHSHTSALAAVTHKTHASSPRTWAWADVAGHTTTAVS